MLQKNQLDIIHNKSISSTKARTLARLNDFEGLGGASVLPLLLVSTLAVFLQPCHH
jgi:hypothetical protein